MTESNRLIDSATVREAVAAHAVYRMYDDAGQLLYVGVTGKLGNRLDSHAEKRWFLLVASIKLEWFRDRTAAEEAEFAAIRDENPEYNLSGAVLKLNRRRVAAKLHMARMQAHLAAKHEKDQVRAVMTLSEAVYAGVFGSRSIDTVRKRVQRARLKHVGLDCNAKLYRLEDLKGLIR